VNSRGLPIRRPPPVSTFERQIAQSLTCYLWPRLLTLALVSSQPSVRRWISPVQPPVHICKGKLPVLVLVNSSSTNQHPRRSRNVMDRNHLTSTSNSYSFHTAPHHPEIKENDFSSFQYSCWLKVLFKAVKKSVWKRVNSHKLCHRLPLGVATGPHVGGDKATLFRLFRLFQFTHSQKQVKF